VNRRIDLKYWLAWTAGATVYFATVILIGRVVTS
jgi:hypothetical protein